MDFMDEFRAEVNQRPFTFASATSDATQDPKLVADMHFEEHSFAEKIGAALLDMAKADNVSEKHVPIFVLVGATSSTGDALGPFIGWFLKRKGFTGEYLGDLNNPVHATNLQEKLNLAWSRATKHARFPWIVGVDAAVGRAGRVTVRHSPLKPGEGMDKKLPSVGSACIMGGTAPYPFMVWFTGLEQTVAMAEGIADGIMSFHRQWVAARRSERRWSSVEDETFFGYCFLPDGTHTPAVTLRGPEAAVGYARLHMRMFPEIRITDSGDFIVLQTKDGVIVFPPAGSSAEKGSV